MTPAVRFKPSAGRAPERWCICGALLQVQAGGPRRGRPATTCGSAACRKKRQRQYLQPGGRALGARLAAPLHAALIALRRTFRRQPFEPVGALAVARRYQVPVDLDSITTMLDHLAEDAGPSHFEKTLTSGGPTYRFPAACEAPVANIVTSASPAVSETGAQLGDEDSEPPLSVTEMRLGGAPASSPEEAGSTVIAGLVSEVRPSIARAASSSAVAATERPKVPLLGLRVRGRQVAHPASRDSRLREHFENLPEAAAEEAKAIRCISPPRVDGGTSFRIEAPVERWIEPLRELSQLLTTGGRLPSTVTLVDGDGVIVTGAVSRNRSAHAFDVLFPGLAQLKFFPLRSLVLLEAKADGVWSLGVEGWMTRWFDRATLFVTGKRSATVTEAWLSGWSVHHLELAADFTRLAFCNDDVQLFTSRSKKVLVRSEPGKELGQVETIYVGARGPDRLALTTHDKSKLLLREGGTPSLSVYAPVWEANGWNGVDFVRRVEVRAAGTALKLRSAKGSTAAPVDLTRPSALLDPTMTRAFWGHATHAKRLVLRPNTGTLKELSKRPVDPRWTAVQAAGTPGQGTYAHDRKEDCSRRGQAARLRLAERTAAGALARLAVLQGGVQDDQRLTHVVGRLLRLPQFDTALRTTGESGEWELAPDVPATR